MDTLNTKNFTIEIDINNGTGWFEHTRLGDHCGGGLWFDAYTLSDYDGVYELPKEVADGIIKMGFNIGDMYPDL